ncbi:M20/M25/M40 family metallo-hydrolase, partial [Phenylobacterium sp.]
SNVPPLRPEENGPAEELARALTGDNSPRTVAYGTEAGQFQDAGLSVVVCGPGSIEQAHQGDEFIELSQIDACMEFMQRLKTRLEA